MLLVKQLCSFSEVVMQLYLSFRFKYSGTSLKRTFPKVDTPLRRTKILAPDEFLRNSCNKISPKWTLLSEHLLKADTSRSHSTLSRRIYLYEAKKEIFLTRESKIHYFTVFTFSFRLNIYLQHIHVLQLSNELSFVPKPQLFLDY